MSDDKASPGPWKWRPVTLESHPSEWEVVVLNDAEGMSVAMLKPGSVSPADARLMTAAPELLEMLERVLAATRDFETEHIEAEALIKRVTGGAR